MTWEQFVSGWSGAYDGYDVRYAAPSRRRMVGLAYRLGAPLAVFGVRPATLTLVSAACSLAVPILAFQRGSWPAVAALAMLCALAADTLACGLTVLTARDVRPGAFYQSLVDRLGEACWLVALALLGARAGAVLAVAVLVWMHEYMRARVGAAALRPMATATVGDRPTRFWLTIVGLILAAITAQLGADLAAGTVTLIVLIWLALALIGLGQLVGLIRRVLITAALAPGRRMDGDRRET